MTDPMQTYTAHLADGRAVAGDPDLDTMIERARGERGYVTDDRTGETVWRHES